MTGASGYKINVAFEDVRAAQVSNDITEMIQNFIDQIDEQLDELLCSHQSHDSNESDRNTVIQLSSDQEIDSPIMFIDDKTDDSASVNNTVKSTEFQ